MKRAEPGGNGDITAELLLLYELSLTVGKSLDAEATCRDFLRVLLARRDLCSASIWWQLGEEDNARLVLLGAMPRNHVTTASLALNPALAQVLHGPAKRVSCDDPLVAALGNCGAVCGGSCALMPLRGEGVLVLRSQADDAFSARMLGQLRSVMEKLATAIQGAIAHASVQREIADRKRVEQALRVSRERLAFALQGSSDGLWDWNLDSNEAYYSPRWKEMLGYRPDELDGDYDTWRTLVHPDDRDATEAIAADYLAGRRSRFEAEFRMRHRDGHWVNILSRATLACDEKGKLLVPRRLVGTHVDITDRKRAESELKRHRDQLEELVAARTADLSVAKSAAEAANRAKSRFLANMSHELRTPMNAIVGLSYMLRRELAEPAQRDKIDKIATAADHLGKLIDDVLDLSRIDAERMELSSESLRPVEVVSRVEALLQDRAAQLGLDLDCEVDPRLDQAVLRGDARRLEQVLLNLAGNALKVTREGGVRLGLSLVAAEEGKAARLQFEVADSGPGIPEDALERIFEPFEQAADTAETSPHGSGLGLSICRDLVRLMGGEIRVSSQLGVGSVFSFSLSFPRDQAQGVGAQPLPTSDAARVLREHHGDRRVMLVEDEPVNQLVATELLREVFGLQVELAATGLEAVARAALAHYDLILMDMQLPEMDGLAAAEAIRKLDAHLETPIVAMTANAFDDDRKACAAAGMNDFIAKPVAPELLARILVKWFEPDRDRRVGDPA